MPEPATDREHFEATAAKFDDLRARHAAGFGGSMRRAVSLPDIESLPVVAEPETCPDCHGTGWRTTAAVTVARCPCQIPGYDGPESIPAADLEMYGCPVDLSGALKSTWDPKRGKWPEYADYWPKRYLDEEGKRPRFLLIHGPFGNGKSRVAAWIMRRMMAAGVRCRWIDVPKTIAEGIRVIGDDQGQRDYRTKVNSWLGKEGVILDDIGGHRDTDYQVEDLFADWVRGRYSHPGWTIGTTNLTLEQLRRFHGRSASRLLSGPDCKMTGGDARRRKWRFALADAIKGAKHGSG